MYDDSVTALHAVYYVSIAIQRNDFPCFRNSANASYVMFAQLRKSANEGVRRGNIP
jgi:hypothetical protein